MKRFDIHICNLDPTVGSEMQKSRPCVVVSPDEMNNILKTVIVVPLTSTKTGLPTRIAVPRSTASGLIVDSYAALDQIKTVDKTRLYPLPIGQLPEATAKRLSTVLCEMFEY